MHRHQRRLIEGGEDQTLIRRTSLGHDRPARSAMWQESKGQPPWLSDEVSAKSGHSAPDRTEHGPALLRRPTEQPPRTKETVGHAESLKGLSSPVM